VLVDINDIRSLSTNRGDVVMGRGWAISYGMREIFVAALSGSSVGHEEVKYCSNITFFH